MPPKTRSQSKRPSRQAKSKAKVSIKQLFTRPKTAQSRKRSSKRRSSKRKEAKLPDARTLRRQRRDEVKDRPYYGPVLPPNYDPNYDPDNEDLADDYDDRPYGPVLPPPDYNPDNKDNDDGPVSPGNDDDNRGPNIRNNGLGLLPPTDPDPSWTVSEKISAAANYYSTRRFIFPDDLTQRVDGHTIDKLMDVLCLKERAHWILRIYYLNGDEKKLPIYYNSLAKKQLKSFFLDEIGGTDSPAMNYRT